MIKNQEAIKKEVNELLGKSTDPATIEKAAKINLMIDEAGQDVETLETKTATLAENYRKVIVAGTKPVETPPKKDTGDDQPKKKSFDEIMSEIIAKRPKA